MKTSLQIRCDEGLRAQLRTAAKKRGLSSSEAARQAIGAYVERHSPNAAPEPVWVALAALAALTLGPVTLEAFIGSLKAHDELEQMAVARLQRASLQSLKH